jgi:hypothetical protein
MGADGGCRGAGDLKRKAIAAVDATAVGVGAPVHVGVQELLDQIAVGGMQFDTVESRFDGELRRLGVLLRFFLFWGLTRGGCCSSAPITGNVARAVNAAQVYTGAIRLAEKHHARY